MVCRLPIDGGAQAQDLFQHRLQIGRFMLRIVGVVISDTLPEIPVRLVETLAENPAPASTFAQKSSRSAWNVAASVACQWAATCGIHIWLTCIGPISTVALVFWLTRRVTRPRR